MVELIQGNYETAKNYYEEMNNGTYFNFSISNPKDYNEINRFLWESKRNFTRFRNVYRGRVLFDISSCNHNELDDFFDAFMYLLKDNENYEVTFLSQDECTPFLMKKLRSFFGDIKVTNLESVRRNPRKKTIGFIDFEEAKE